MTSDSAVINVLTGRSARHNRLLAALMEWTTDKDIVRSMLTAGVADFHGLRDLALRVKATTQEGGISGVEPLPEREAAQYVLGFLARKTPRRAVAGYVARSYHVSPTEAIRGLKDLRSELVRLCLEA